MKSLLLVCLLFVGCASNTVYGPGTTTTKHGDRAVAVKRFQQQGDIIGDQKYVFGRDGTLLSLTITTPDPNNVAIKRIAVLNNKGQLVTDKNGNPVFNETPMVAMSTPSSGTEAMYSGLNRALRGLGSMIGTVGTTIASVVFANGAATGVDEAAVR